MSISWQKRLVNGALIGALMLTLMGTVVTVAPSYAQDYEPVFETADCWWELPESQPVECGYLVVPEDRSNPGGKQVRVAVAIARHPAGNPEPDPIVYIHGGPGGGFMQFFNLEYPTITEFFETNRDVIYFDQRGNGFSEPSLECPAFGDALFEAFDLTIDGESVPVEQAQQYALQAFIDCGEAWSQQVDLTMYDSPTAAADLNDLRIALGYDELNIYAESYGPRVAQSLMRDYPDTVRSVAMDAAMSTHSPVDEFVSEFGEMLNQLFDYCAADEACNTAYPDLKNVWLQTLEQFDANPLNMTGGNPFTGEDIDFVVDAGILSTAIWRLSYSNSGIPVIPMVIYATSQGDYSLLQEILSEVAWVSLNNWGAWAAVTCRQSVPISNIEDFDAALAEYPEAAGFAEGNLFVNRQTFFTESLCETWSGGSPAPESEFEPVVSNIPTLIMLGDTDPASHVDESMQIAETLENHFGPYSFPFLSHVVFGKNACPTSIVTAFITDPTTEPDSSCIAEMSGATFTIPGKVASLPSNPIQMKKAASARSSPLGGVN